MDMRECINVFVRASVSTLSSSRSAAFAILFSCFYQGIAVKPIYTQADVPAEVDKELPGKYNWLIR